MISQLWVNCNTWKMLKILINILGKLWCKIWILQTLKRHIFVASPKHFWEPKAINFMETFQPLEESSSRRYPRGRFPGDHKENLWVPKGRKRNNYEVWANWELTLRKGWCVMGWLKIFHPSINCWSTFFTLLWNITISANGFQDTPL